MQSSLGSCSPYNQADTMRGDRASLFGKLPFVVVIGHLSVSGSFSAGFGLAVVSTSSCLYYAPLYQLVFPLEAWNSVLTLPLNVPLLKPQLFIF